MVVVASLLLLGALMALRRCSSQASPSGVEAAGEVSSTRFPLPGRDERQNPARRTKAPASETNCVKGNEKEEVKKDVAALWILWPRLLDLKRCVRALPPPHDASSTHQLNVCSFGSVMYVPILRVPYAALVVPPTSFPWASIVSRGVVMGTLACL
jgi:hypothetical protein